MVTAASVPAVCSPVGSMTSLHGQAAPLLKTADASFDGVPSLAGLAKRSSGQRAPHGQQPLCVRRQVTTARAPAEGPQQALPVVIVDLPHLNSGGHADQFRCTRRPEADPDRRVPRTAGGVASRGAGRRTSVCCPAGMPGSPRACRGWRGAPSRSRPRRRTAPSSGPAAPVHRPTAPGTPPGR